MHPSACSLRCAPATLAWIAVASSLRNTVKSAFAHMFQRFAIRREQIKVGETGRLLKQNSSALAHMFERKGILDTK